MSDEPERHFKGVPESAEVIVANGARGRGGGGEAGAGREAGESTMRIRAKTMDVIITADGPDAGSPEVHAVLTHLCDMIAALYSDPEVIAVRPKRNRRDRRVAEAKQRGRQS